MLYSLTPDNGEIYKSTSESKEINLHEIAKWMPLLSSDLGHCPKRSQSSLDDIYLYPESIWVVGQKWS